MTCTLCALDKVLCTSGTYFNRFVCIFHIKADRIKQAIVDCIQLALCVFHTKNKPLIACFFPSLDDKKENNKCIIIHVYSLDCSI